MVGSTRLLAFLLLALPLSSIATVVLSPSHFDTDNNRNAISLSSPTIYPRQDTGGSNATPPETDGATGDRNSDASSTVDPQPSATTGKSTPSTGSRSEDEGHPTSKPTFTSESPAPSQDGSDSQPTTTPESNNNGECSSCCVLCSHPFHLFYQACTPMNRPVSRYNIAWRSLFLVVSSLSRFVSAWLLSFHPPPFCMTCSYRTLSGLDGCIVRSKDLPPAI